MTLLKRKLEKVQRVFAVLTIALFSIFAIVSCAKEEGGSENAIPQDVQSLVSGYNLEPLSKEDSDYVINLGYYDCDHMTAACVGEDTGIFKALGLKVSVTGNGNVPEAMSAGKMDVAYAYLYF